VHMKLNNPLGCFIVLALAMLVMSPSVVSQQATGSNTTQPDTAASYPNTSDGLHLLLNDLLLTAKNDDQTKLRSQIAEMEIPNFDEWFTHTLGPERGAKLGSLYGKSLQADELEFALLCMELANQKGEISIQKVDATKRYGTLTGPLDEYHASWKKTDDSAGPDIQSIGTFYFADGKFRLNGSLHDVRILSAGKARAVVPAKLINSPQPVYPNLARQSKIQGMVSVNVIVRKDGTVMVQNVGAGHPLLAPAALAAVQQWRYQPATLNGDPVEIQTKIYVSFTLSN
jgi:TonB family protein